MTLPWRARLWLWLMVAGAAGALGLWAVPAVWMVVVGAASVPPALALAQLVALATLAQHFPLSLGKGRKLDLSLPAHLASLLLAGPALGIAVVGLGEALGQGTLALRRDRRTRRRMRGFQGAVFNTSQLIVSATLAGVAMLAVERTLAPLLPASLHVLAPGALVLAAGSTLYLANTAAVATMVALHGGTSPLAVWLEGRGNHALQSAGLLVLGVLTAHTASASPWVPLAMALPAALTYVALRRTAEAEAAVRLRDEFLGAAAHELRTPLTSLRGYAQLLASQMDRGVALDEARLTRSLQTIDRQSGKLCDLIDQLLDVARLQERKLALDPRLFDLTEAVRETVAALQPLTPGYALLTLNDEPVPVLADRLRLEQVLTNLVTNAARYAGKGDRIEVEVRREAGKALLAVRDYGVGIAPEHRERIFDRFYQAGADSKAGGLGIGLYITREIVELHGGRIWVECPRSGGTCFIVSLPALAGAAVPFQSPVAAQPHSVGVV